MDGEISALDAFCWDDEPTRDAWAAAEVLDGDIDEIGSITVALDGAISSIALPWDLAPRSPIPPPPPSSQNGLGGLPPSWARVSIDSQPPSEPQEKPAWLGDPEIDPASESEPKKPGSDLDAIAAADVERERAAVAEANAAANDALSAYAELRSVVTELKRIADALHAPAAA